MSYFNPYSAYATRLPVLKPGYMIRIADKYYMVVAVRRNRKKVTVTGAKTEDYKLDKDSASTLATMTGSLVLNRVVHIQYVSIDTDIATTFKWLTLPLLSKDLVETIQTDRANLLAPLEVDRYSYDVAMSLAIQQPSTQNYYFELIEYEVTPYVGTPSQFLHIMANGFAIFVESQEQGKTLANALQAIIQAAQK